MNSIVIAELYTFCFQHFTILLLGCDCVVVPYFAIVPIVDVNVMLNI